MSPSGPSGPLVIKIFSAYQQALYKVRHYMYMLVINLHSEQNLHLNLLHIVKWVLLPTVKTQTKCHIMSYFIRVYTVCKDEIDLQ